MKEDIMVYQYKICPFCNKLKAVMDYLGIPYKVTEVSKPLCCAHRAKFNRGAVLCHRRSACLWTCQFKHFALLFFVYNS